MGFKTRKYIMEKNYQVPRDKVWQLLSDTDNLNRVIGLFSVQFSSAKKKKNETFTRKAFARVAGIIPLTWEESPFQWVTNQFYSVERNYINGPLRHFVGGVELDDTDDENGTRVRLIGEFTPRNILGIAAIPITGVSAMRNTMKYMDEFVKLSAPSASKEKTKQDVDLSELDRLEKKLQPMQIEPDLTSLLRQRILTHIDPEVINMRPKAIAKEWKKNSLDVLRLFLYATRTGILSLSWNLICPNCRVSKAEHTSLTNVMHTFHCDLCGVTYDTNFDKYVELMFSVHPSIRKAYSATYCVGGPLITPHIFVQQIVKPGETVRIPLPSLRNQLQLRVLQANHKVSLEKNNHIAVTYTEKGFCSTHKSSNTGITVNNKTAHEIVLVLERTDWNEDAVTAAEVTAMQEFRELFSGEVLAPGQQVGIENVTILFSDLEGSTSMYEEIGDANAYGQVRRHFNYLTEWISKNNGSVVKTIGDAVMAVFYQPENGVHAALNIQKNIEAYNKKHEQSIVLKIGLYSGPAIVVNSNNRLDYFGRTVNIAARIQNESTGGDIVVHKSYVENQKIRHYLEQNSVSIEPYTSTLKGINDDFELMRIR